MTSCLRRHDQSHCESRRYGYADGGVSNAQLDVLRLTGGGDLQERDDAAAWVAESRGPVG
jgi:hypothetical protein